MKNQKSQQPSRHKYPGRIGAAGVSRRNFVKSAASLAAVAATVPLKPMLGGNESVAEAAVAGGNSANRTNDCFNYRKSTAQAEKINIAFQPDNGDTARFTDFSCSYSKGLWHDHLGVPNAAALLSLRNAFATGNPSDFANIIVGTPGGGPNSKLNGPQVALAFDLEGLDSHCTFIPAAPSVASAQTAAEQVEHYWAALLADVPFTEYATNSLAGQAVADMNNLSFLRSAANNQFPYPVTRQNLFCGQFVRGDGNVQGPYISQFMIQPTPLGAQPLDQKYQTFASGQEFMTTLAAYKHVQKGGASVGSLSYDPTYRYLR